jgi:hypothetical protein
MCFEMCHASPPSDQAIDWLRGASVPAKHVDGFWSWKVVSGGKATSIIFFLGYC